MPLTHVVAASREKVQCDASWVKGNFASDRGPAMTMAGRPGVR